MIGIGSINASDREYGSSDEYNSDDYLSSAISPHRLSISSYQKSKRNVKKVQDEAFFVTIEIEDTFLSWLDEPEFIVPLDVIEKVSSLV